MDPSGQQLFCGERELDGATLRRQAAQAASGFAALGLQPGDTVAVMLRNDLPYLALMLALSRLGVHLVAVNWHFLPAEAGFVLRDSEARALVVHADLWPRVAEVLPPGVTVLVVDTPDDIVAAYGLDAAATAGPPGALRWTPWLDGFEPHTAPPAPPLGSMLYSSGTTGRPKAVMRLPGTPRQHEGAARVRRLASRAREGLRTAVVGPLYHAGPNGAARVALDLAERIVVMPRFDAEGLLQAIEAHRLTHLSMVPIHFVRLLKLPEAVRARYDLSSLENVTHGGSPCAPELRRAMIDWWGPIVTETYGSTETGLVTLCPADEWLQRPGTVGRPMPGMRLRILGPEGQPLPPGEVGEIAVDPGDNALPFTYRHQPEARAAIDRDGFIATGDVGRLDDEGYLYISDRARDLVISGGVNIYPAEIEHVLVTHPQVADCAVFGIPDAEYGEALAAAVQPQPGEAPDADSLRAWLRERLAGYKLPRLIEFHAELPREAMGKVFKRRLREPHWAGHARQV